METLDSEDQQLIREDWPHLSFLGHITSVLKPKGRRNWPDAALILNQGGPRRNSSERDDGGIETRLLGAVLNSRQLSV